MSKYQISNINAAEMSGRLKSYRRRPIMTAKRKTQSVHLQKHVGMDIWEPAYEEVGNDHNTETVESIKEFKYTKQQPSDFKTKNGSVNHQIKLNRRLEETDSKPIEARRLAVNSRTEKIIGTTSVIDADATAESNSGNSEKVSNHADAVKEPIALKTTNDHKKQKKISSESKSTKKIKILTRLTKLKNIKITKGMVKNYSLYAMAIFVFLIGVVAALRSVMVDHQIAQTVSAQSNEQSDESEEGIVEVDESKPSDRDVKYYSVGPDMPKIISIPKLGKKARVNQLGKKADGSLDAPKNIYDVGWYVNSAKPGSAGGAAIIDGHVSGPTTKGVFYKLESLSTGDLITIELGNGTKIDYSVVKSETEKATSLDMKKLMVSVTKGKHGLNLITCTGKFDSKSRTYEDRAVVYAEYVKTY